MKNRSFISLLFLAACASASDWPRFRGPTADGRVTETQVPLRWSATENIAWKTDLPGPGSSSPIVSAGRVFVTCWSGYGLNLQQPSQMSALKRHAICLDRRDGRILWNIAVADPAPDTPYQGPYLS